MSPDTIPGTSTSSPAVCFFDASVSAFTLSPFSFIQMHLFHRSRAASLKIFVVVTCEWQTNTVSLNGANCKRKLWCYGVFPTIATIREAFTWYLCVIHSHPRPNKLLLFPRYLPLAYNTVAQCALCTLAKWMKAFRCNWRRAVQNCRCCCCCCPLTWTRFLPMFCLFAFKQSVDT